VYIVGDAERMIAQAGADQAANAFLKLLEEPPADTYIILTSSEPGALLPTIRSRAVSVRVSPLLPADLTAFLKDSSVLEALGGPPSPTLATSVAGAPGRLFGRDGVTAAEAAAKAILDAATSGDEAKIFRAAFVQGTAKARGKFSDTLDALTGLLRDHSLALVSRDARRARGASAAIGAVERAKEFAENNGNPELITATLLREITPLLS
jgi:DNA polymerase-3 subunit delta'